MNNFESSTEGSQSSSSSEIEEIKKSDAPAPMIPLVTTTMATKIILALPSEPPIVAAATTSPTNTTTTTTSIDDDNKSNENQENLVIYDSKCTGSNNTVPVLLDTKPSSSSSLIVSTVGAASVSYAAIAAMDTESATAALLKQHQQQTQHIEAINSSDDCDKNSTRICDKILTTATTKPLETAEPQPALATEVVSEVVADAVDLKASRDDAVDSKKNTSLPVANASASSSLIENKENTPDVANISTTTTPTIATATTLSGSELNSKNSLVPVAPAATVLANDYSTLLAQKKHHHQLSLTAAANQNHKIHHVLTTTASAPILMQSASSPSIGSAVRNSTVGGSSSSILATSMGLNSSSGPMITRRVSFPKSDEALVTGYLEPANPWEHVCMVKSISEIAELYVQSCNKHNTIPIPSVLDHLKHIELDKTIRQPILLLKNIKLTPADCEALEEIFKRVQYKSIDVSSCELNETAASALFDMFEYYEVTNELDISSNADGMTPRGWTSCIYMVSHSRALQVLNAQGNPLSKNCADNLGSALNSSNLHTIKLEHCGLRGNPLDSLCTKLRNNQTLKELWLAYNDLTCLDADKIAQLLRTNHYLQLIDISNNNIKDEGLMKIVKALIEQSTELERQRIAAAALAYAISEAEHKKRMLANSNNKNGTNTNNTTNNATTQSSITNSQNGTNGMGASTDDEMTSGDSDASPAEEDDDDEDEDDDDDDEADDADVDTDANDAEDDDGTTTEDDGGGPRGGVEDDDDDEDTVKTSTIKTTPPINGQSKLDKLLSMNNSDSSEEAPTDTVAASDISVSDDIFDSTNVVVPVVVASTPIVEPILDQPVALNNNNNNNTSTSAVLFEENELVEEETVLAAIKPAQTPTKALDVNKNSTKLDDFDDTHSTDSAFESSSDGDISRHLPDEFVDRFDSSKDEVETATIATEALTTPTPTPTPPPAPVDVQPSQLSQPQTTTATTTTTTISVTAATTTTPKPIEVATQQRLTASSISPNTSCDSSSGDISAALKNAALTGTSPSPASSGGGGGMRRTESTCTITQSTRVRSHSSDSLSSDNSLDGSISDTASGNFSTRINEKLTKNDTLTRQKQFDVPVVDSSKTPHGLKALTLWNNNLTKESGPLIADLLATTVSLELLNVGKNILSNDFVASIRDSLSENKTLTTLGLQSAHLSCAGIRTLSSILQFGGNNTLTRIDIRDNKIEVESLNMLAEALKSNTTVTQIDIDDEPKRLSIGSDAQLDYARVLDNVRSLCSRNENQPPPSAATAADKTTAILAAKRRGGYYLGSRKISLTCHSAPPRAAILNDQSSSSQTNSSTGGNVATSTTTNGSKLEVKKKTGVRLRSPIPSPPTISPSSSPVPSPSKSRFQVFRVSEVSPLTSPMTPSPSPSPTPSPTPNSSGVIIMNSKDSTTTIKRLSTSPRSRFHVMKIYEDPCVPIAHRTLPPITPSPSPPTTSTVAGFKISPLTMSSPLSSSSVQIIAANSRIVTTPSPPCKFEEQKIVTTPATPPIQEKAEEKEPDFTVPATVSTIESITNSATNTKSNLNSNESTNPINIVKPNDRVDGAVAPRVPSPVQHVPQPQTDAEESTKLQKHLCPQLPVVEDDQRTLTNSLDVDISTSNSCAQTEITTQSTNDPQAQEVSTAQDLQSEPAVLTASPASEASPVAARTRKNSWIPNSTYPGTVDRLLSMFQNPAHLFHRSSSPDTTASATTTANSTPPPSLEDQSNPPAPPQSNATAITTTDSGATQVTSEDLQQSLVPLRRRTPPLVAAATNSQFPSWCKLGTEMCKPVTSVMQTAAAVSSGYVSCSGPPTTAVIASVEPPRSFFDAASKQLRDFSKQVFRQNIAFGNEAAININHEQQQLLLQQQQHHDCDIIPSDMKLEIKENISPEHTINEEQLQSLQKIGGSPGSSSTSSSGTETTEGASIPSSSSSPSSLLSVPLLGISPQSQLPLTEEDEAEVSPSSVSPTPPILSSSSSVSPKPQPLVPNEEQSCNS